MTLSPHLKLTAALCLAFALSHLDTRAAYTWTPPPAPAPAQAPGPEYKLVWEDDYSKQPDGPPDPKKWSYEVGFLRNHELQYYTKERLENVRIEKGELVIEGRKEDYTPPDAPPPLPRPIAHYTSGAIETAGKAEWQYGRIEVRAKLPVGKGTWPAIWTIGADAKREGAARVPWPKCGEIDIMEFIGKMPGVIHGTLHCFVNGAHASSGGLLPVEHLDNAFHVYSIEWTPQRIEFYVDGFRYYRFDTAFAINDGQNPFQQPHYLILNLALGGDWGGPIDDSIFPQRMTIDYVRVYQKETAPAAPTPTPTTSNAIQ